jgi:hypothetical protein
VQPLLLVPSQLQSIFAAHPVLNWVGWQTPLALHPSAIAYAQANEPPPQSAFEAQGRPVMLPSDTFPELHAAKIAATAVPLKTCQRILFMGDLL